MASTSSEALNGNSVPQYLDGHYGVLNAYQQEVLDDFRSFVVERGYSDFQTATPLHDVKLLRFLRARRWDVEAAYTQFNDTETWRQTNQIDTLYETIDTEAYQELRHLYPQWTGRRDRLGAPLYVYAPQRLTGQIVAASENRAASADFSLAKRDAKTSASPVCFATLLDNLLRFTQPLATQLANRTHPAAPVTLSTYIVDLSGISALQFWSLRSHIRTLACLVSAHYPETLGSIFIVGAPAFFGTVFGWIRGWLDPVTVSKIRIVGPGEAQAAALEAAIDRRNIPKAYGGALDYKFGDAPVLDPALKGIVDWEGAYSSFPLAPLVWEPAEGSRDRVACIKVGRQDGQPSPSSQPLEVEVGFPFPDVVAYLNEHCSRAPGLFCEGVMAVESADLSTGSPFSIRVLDNGENDAVVDSDHLLKLLPAVCLPPYGAMGNFRDRIEETVRGEFNLVRFAGWQKWLWLAGARAPPPPLHHQIVVGREIVITEQMERHLVWTTRRVFIKPMPRFLLEPRFWTEHLSGGGPRSTVNRRCALGFLFSYVAMLCYESDFDLARERRLVPPEVKWPAWRALVQELDLERIPLHVHPRFLYGGLKQNRLNLMMMPVVEPALSSYGGGRKGARYFLNDKFAWLAALMAYVVIVLTALQVGLATNRLGSNASFQSFSYGFTVFSILLPIVTAVVILAFSGCVFMVSLGLYLIRARMVARRRDNSLEGP